MIILKEDSKIKDRFYAKSHQKGRGRTNWGPVGEYFEEEPLTEIEDAIREYSAGMYDLPENIKAEIKQYIRNAPTLSSPIYRVEDIDSDTRDIQIGDTITRDISSWSKTDEFAKNVINERDDWGHITDPLVLKMINPKSINIEGYSSFYYQKESLSCGKLKVVGLEQFEGVPLVIVKQVSI